MLPVQEDGFVVVAKIGAPHGIAGWVRVHSFTEPSDNIMHYGPWHLQNAEGQWQPHDCLEIQPHRQAFIAKLDGVEDRDEAALLCHAQIAIRREDMPELAEDEAYIHDLIGYAVENTQGEMLGVVIEIFATGANDVMVVKGDKKHLIPYVLPEFIVQVETATKKIVVNWDPGVL